MVNARNILIAVVMLGVFWSCTTPQSEVKQTMSPAVPAVQSRDQTDTAAPKTQCATDADCVKASCCHASACVPVAQKPDCRKVMCTMSCSGPMDCGKGHCACVGGMCGVAATVKNPPPELQSQPAE